MNEPQGDEQWEGSGIILVDRVGRVLLQQRDDDHGPEGYGRWALPGGGHEGEETPRETAIRELEEETGLRVARVRYFRSFDQRDHPAFEHRTLHLFFADDEVDERAIHVNEGLDFRFWAPEDALGLRINPAGRLMLTEFLESDLYKGLVQRHAPFTRGVAVLELDRWGRVLLQLRDDDLPPELFPGTWTIPGGLMDTDEAPDEAGLREFEEETGHLLEEIRFWRTFRRPELASLMVDVQHVYFVDADLPEEHISVNEGQAFRYFAASELEALPMTPYARDVLELFFVSPPYKALFH
ncbi:MAG: NUDIX hydrolase [Dehalococcoidia bacterium]|nr:NUDIX hydrolase [Dehalococcoidia bacterium]